MQFMGSTAIRIARSAPRTSTAITSINVIYRCLSSLVTEATATVRAAASPGDALVHSGRM